MLPAINETVSYMSMSGMHYEAKVRQVHPNGRIDIDVDAGTRQPVLLTEIEWIEQRSFATRGTAGPKAPV